MKALTPNEVAQVSGGIPALLVFFAGEALYGYSIYQTAKWLGTRNRP